MRIIFAIFCVITCCPIHGQTVFDPSAKEISSIRELYYSSRYEEVTKSAKELMTLDPTNGYSYHIIGLILVQESKFDSSIPYLQKSIYYDNDSSFVSGWAHANLGYAYIHLGKTADGIAELKRSIALVVSAQYEKSVRRTLDSLGNKLPEKEYPKNFLPDWVAINGYKIEYNFQDTAGLTSSVYKYIQQHEQAYDSLNRVFQATPPNPIRFYVWNDHRLGKKIVHDRVGFAHMKECFSHEHRNQTVGHELAHILAYWAWNSEPKSYSKFITEGIAVCFDLYAYDKYAYARRVIKKEGITDVMNVWRKDKKCKDKILYPVGGAFVTYLYRNSSPEQFKEVVKNQKIDDVKKIYGDSFDKIITDFNHLMGLK